MNNEAQASKRHLKGSLDGKTPGRSHFRQGNHIYPRAITSCPGLALCRTWQVKCTIGRGDFQFFSRIFLAFCAYPPMTIRFNIVYLKMSVSIWETPRHDPI